MASSPRTVAQSASSTGHHLRFQQALPAAYRVGDVLAFHQRDALQLSEVVEGTELRKGLVWRGQPAQLTLCLVHAGEGAPGGVASADLWVDGEAAHDPAEQDQFECLVRRMLGLGQGVAAFEAAFLQHAVLGPLLVRQRGLHVPAASTPWEALSWAVTGQQISVAAATSLRRKLIAASGVQHSAGLRCTPDAAQVARLKEADLRAAGFSVSKTSTLLRLAQAVVIGDLPLDDWARLPVLPADDIRTALLSIKGIGPWTVGYTLLRGYGWLDGALQGDVAVRKAIALLTGQDKLTEKQAELWLAPFAPWRALVGAHLWASLSNKAY